MKVKDWQKATQLVHERQNQAATAPTVTSWPAFWLFGLGLTPCSALSVKGIMALSRTALTPGYGILFK